MLGVLSVGWGLTREVVMEMGTGVVTREWWAEKGHKATPDYNQSVLIALK